MIYEHAQKFTFKGQAHPCWVIGERVVMFAPLPELPQDQPVVSQFRSLSLEQYLNHQQQLLIRAVEQLFMNLMKTYGQDCHNFEITLDEAGKPNGVIFTRPMDRVETAQIRSWRSRDTPPPPAPRIAGEQAASDRTLPDPATLRPMNFAH